MQFPRPLTFPLLRTESLTSDRDTPPASGRHTAVSRNRNRPGAAGQLAANRHTATAGFREGSSQAGQSAAGGAATVTVKRPVTARRQVLSMQEAGSQVQWQDRLSRQQQQINRRLDQIHTKLQRLAGPADQSEQPQLSIVGLPAEE